jgi:hypothetical protein
LNFNGSADGYTLPGFFNLGSAALFIVARYRDKDTDGQYLFFGRNSAVLIGSRFGIVPGANTTAFVVDSSSGIGSVASDEVWHVFEGLHVGTTARHFIDGSERGNSSRTSTAAVENIGVCCSVANNGIIVGGYCNCQVGEIIIVNNLDNQTKIEGYLAWKWGLTPSLPALHPYKNERPTI